MGRSYRAIARRFGKDLYWVGIGSHEDYNDVLRRLKQGSVQQKPRRTPRIQACRSGGGRER